MLEIDLELGILAWKLTWNLDILTLKKPGKDLEFCSGHLVGTMNSV